METAAIVAFILCIAYWSGYRGVARTFGDSHLRSVLKRRTYAVALSVALCVAIMAMTMLDLSVFRLGRSGMLTLAGVMVMVLAIFSCLRVSTSAVTAFWGALLAMMYHQGAVDHYPLLAVLLSLLAIPLFSCLMTWVYGSLFNRFVYHRKGHLLLNLLFVRRLALVGVMLAGIGVALNCSLLFSTLLSGITSDFATIYKWVMIAGTIVVCAIGVMRWRPDEQGHTQAMPQGLPSLYAIATSLLIGIVVSVLLMPVSVPVILSANQLKASNDLLLHRDNPARQMLKLLSITLLTPLVAFLVGMVVLKLESDIMLTVAVAAFTLLTSVLVYLYSSQYSEHRETQNALHDELVHKNEVGDEMNRMDMAAVTSQFDVMTKEIDLKHKELVNLSLYIKQQRQYLEDLSQRLAALSQEEDARLVGEKLREEAVRLNETIKLSDEMDQFYTQVEEIHKNFVSRLQMRCPNLTEREKRLAILLRLGFSSKEIAQLMNVEPKSVEINRYRFRRKLKLDRGINMVQYLQLL